MNNKYKKKEEKRLEIRTINPLDIMEDFRDK